MFLNFNYTNTISYYNLNRIGYIDNGININSKIINIHGELNSNQNKIIFGYGDELDDSYHLIEKSTNQEYLEYIKSVRYLDTPNYRNFLEFIESDLYQVYILGHSCGLSDRTLLNTLFEHDNCVSIKPFYYKDDNGKDNYRDLVKNITRNFNNKKKLRDRVVNKKFCRELI